MDDLHVESPPPPPPRRFSIPAVVAGFTAPLMIWAISIAGLSFFPPVTELLYVEYPYENYAEGDRRVIDAAGDYGSYSDYKMVLRYTPLEQDTIAAAAEDPAPDIANRTWAYGGKQLGTQDLIATMTANHKAWGKEILQAVELNCFNNDALGVQGAIFEFYTADPEHIDAFNRYDAQLDKKLESFSPLTPVATQADFSACLALRQQVKAELDRLELS